jgi:aminoglycoside phosphotransferase family enzyme/predicted kinase
MGSLKDDLSRSAREVRETHISWVFLHDDEVYKVKKPVNFGFLDFSTVDLRKAACDAEVELNRRLAGDVYRGIVPISLDEHGTHQLGSHGPVVDWAVAMRRLRDRDGADRMLETGELQVAHVDAIARHLAAFHATARHDAKTTSFGDPSKIEKDVLDNFSGLRANSSTELSTELSDVQLQSLETGQLQFISTHDALFRERMSQGRIRDGHGDLKLEHCYLENGGIVILDCIEFNEAFRCGDVCSDLAFLAMDLSARHRVDLAERLLAAYAQEANDADLYPLVDFYQGYRACVRAKVSGLLARDTTAPLALRDRARRDVRRHLMLALAEQHRSLQRPCVIAVGGVIASGKSTLADRLSFLLGGPVISSDRVRKHLVGVSPTTELPHAAWQGAYCPEMSIRVYDEVLRRARVVVSSRRPVVLDCSYHSQNERFRARALAQALGVPFWFIECRADADLCRARLLQREEGAHVSDGRLALFEEFSRHWEPVALDQGERLAVDTGQPLEENMDKLSAILPLWPAQLRG